MTAIAASRSRWRASRTPSLTSVPFSSISPPSTIRSFSPTSPALPAALNANPNATSDAHSWFTHGWSLVKE